MLHVHVTDGVIDHVPCGIPTSWQDAEGNTHVLTQQSPEELGALGWLEYSETHAELGPDMKWAAPTYTFTATTCVAHYAAIAMEQAEADAAREVQWADVRHERDVKLTASDWVVVRSGELQQPVPADWVLYRQQLRDVPQQPDPFAIVWPEVPPPPVWLVV